jgi:hypothetical protein
MFSIFAPDNENNKHHEESHSPFGSGDVQSAVIFADQPDGQRSTAHAVRLVKDL